MSERLFWLTWWRVCPKMEIEGGQTEESEGQNPTSATQHLMVKWYVMCCYHLWCVRLWKTFKDWLINFNFNVTVTILFVVVNLISLVKITGFSRFCLFIDTFQNYCFQCLTTLALNMGIPDQAEVKEGEQKCEEGVKLGQEAGFISPCFTPAASSGPCFICSTPDSPLCPDCEKVPTNYHFSTFLESHHHHSQCQFDQHYEHYNGHWVSRLCFTHAIQVKLQNRNPPTKSCFVKWKKLWSQQKETAQLKVIVMPHHFTKAN